MPILAPVPEDTPYRPLADALWTWASAAAQWWKNTNAHTTACVDFYVQVEPDVFERRCRIRSMYVYGSIEWAFNLPPFRLIAHAMAAEPSFRPYLGKLIGVENNLIRFDPAHFAQAVVPVDVKFDEVVDLQFAQPNRIEQFLRRIHGFVSSETTDVVYVTPLWNLEVPTPLCVEPGLTIDVMTDEEALKALEMNAITGDLATGRRYQREPGADLVLRRVIARKNKVLDRPPTRDEAIAAGQEVPENMTGYADVGRVVQLLPLLSAGDVRVGGTMHWNSLGPPWGHQGVVFGGGAQPMLDDRPRPHRLIRLDADDSPQLVRLWQEWNAIGAGAPRLALRRLGFANSRLSEDDRLLDLIIAAEALFVPDDDDHGELKFQVSLHAAFYLAEELAQRTLIYEYFRKAYDVRSTLAHGREAGISRVAGEKVDIRALTSFVGENLRLALLKRLETGAAPDWQALVFGVEDTSGTNGIVPLEVNLKTKSNSPASILISDIAVLADRAEVVKRCVTLIESLLGDITPEELPKRASVLAARLTSGRIDLSQRNVARQVLAGFHVRRRLTRGIGKPSEMDNPTLTQDLIAVLGAMVSAHSEKAMRLDTRLASILLSRPLGG